MPIIYDYSIINFFSVVLIKWTFKTLQKSLQTSEMREIGNNFIIRKIELKEERITIELKIEKSKEDDFIDIDELITNTKTILKNPSFIRELWNIQLQKMLIWLLFNNKIFYDKKSGFQTPEMPLIYKHL